MIKQLLDEVRSAPLDDAARARLAEIHERSLRELEEGLSPELVAELHRITLPFVEDQAAVRRRAPDRAGAAGRLARGAVPRHPDGAGGPADGGAGPADRDAPPAALRPGVRARCRARRRTPAARTRPPGSTCSSRRVSARAGGGASSRRRLLAVEAGEHDRARDEQQPDDLEPVRHLLQHDGADHRGRRREHARAAPRTSRRRTRRSTTCSRAYGITDEHTAIADDERRQPRVVQHRRRRRRRGTARAPARPPPSPPTAR